MSESESRLLLDPSGVAASVTKLADLIAGKTPAGKKLTLIGIYNRGVPLAQRLTRELLAAGGREVQCGSIDITQYRDDLDRFSVAPKLYGSDIPFSIDDEHVILCDEVIYTGRSVRAALDELLDHGRPSQVQLAALVDRAGRELPIQPDFVALDVEVEEDERVAVRFREVDGEDCVKVQSTRIAVES
jgi:pyrimidine operon attenuation protein/uracil phosphoribosyltransferase